VLDYGSGNLRSAVRALVRAGAEVELTSDAARARQADALVVPGVGAYAACMAGLHEVDGVALVRDWVGEGRPLLGICVGFQVLFTSGTEHGETTEGIGVFTGEVSRLDAQRLPHMGWNTVETSERVETSEAVRYYFVHSYGVAADTEISLVGRPEVPVERWLTTHDGHRFVAAVAAGPVLATQFHPEKSADAGAALLRGWVSAIQNR